MKRDFNLFGEPLPRNLGKVGRNEHVPTAEKVSQVRQLVLAGWTTEKIAEEIGISRPTLRKHYLPNIDRARVAALGETKAKIIMLLQKSADEGNVAAMKELMRIIREEELVLGVGTNPPAEQQPKAEKVGKKEQAHQAAQTADEGTEWRSLLN